MSAAPRVVLRRWEEADLPALLRLRNDVALQAQLLARARGSDEPKVRAWLAARDAAGAVLLVVADAADGRVLGYVQAVDLDREDGRADVGICLAPEAQGRGLGSEAMRALLGHLHAREGIGKVTLRVRADNARAIRCYRGLGFRECGLLRAHARFDGRWIDVVAMEAFLDPARAPRTEAAHG